MEECFQALSTLASKRWRLISVSLLDESKHFTQLPADAFDGELFEESLMELRQEWERLLCRTGDQSG